MLAIVRDVQHRATSRRLRWDAPPAGRSPFNDLVTDIRSVWSHRYHVSWDPIGGEPVHNPKVEHA
jgi:hypothetical protein